MGESYTFNVFANFDYLLFVSKIFHLILGNKMFNPDKVLCKGMDTILTARQRTVKKSRRGIVRCIIIHIIIHGTTPRGDFFTVLDRAVVVGIIVSLNLER